MNENEKVILINEEPVGAVAEAELAVEREEVTFSMVIKILYLQSFATNAHVRERYRGLYRPALAQFTAAHGGICESFYADEFCAGVMLTGKSELFSELWWDEFKFDTTPARAIEADINDLRLRAGLYLSEQHREICLQRLLRLYKGLISSLRLEWYRTSDDGAVPSERHVADLEQLRRELGVVEERYRGAGLARGQERYVFGAALGTVVIVALAGAAAVIAGPGAISVWLGVSVGGAIGAMLSVLERLTRGSLSVRFEAERLGLSGISRPIVGALSGLALFVLIEGDIVPLDVAGGEGGRGLLFMGIAFLAGFSERLAKDVFGNATGSLPVAKNSPLAANDAAKRPT